jgi:hypothetical protein
MEHNRYNQHNNNDLLTTFIKSLYGYIAVYWNVNKLYVTKSYCSPRFVNISPLIKTNRCLPPKKKLFTRDSHHKVRSIKPFSTIVFCSLDYTTHVKMKTEQSVACCLPAPCRDVCVLYPRTTCDDGSPVRSAGAWICCSPEINNVCRLPHPHPRYQSHLQQFTKHASQSVKSHYYKASN